MTSLYERSLNKLELDRVLENLAQCACSAEGKLSCLQLAPVSNIDEVQRMLDETSAAIQLSIRKGNPGFHGISDVSESLGRAERGGSLQMNELLQIGGVLRCARTAKSYITEDDETTVLDPIFQVLTPNKYLEDRIFTAILSEEEMSDAASTELADIRRHMRIQGAKIRESLQKIISSSTYSKLLREPIITIRQGRYVVPVKSECKNDIPGLVHDVSATGNT